MTLRGRLITNKSSTDGRGVKSANARDHRPSFKALPSSTRANGTIPRLLQRSNSVTSTTSDIFTEAEAKDRWKNIGKCIIMVSNVASEFQKLEVTRKEIEKTQDQIKSYLEHKFEVDKKYMFDPSIFKRPKQEIFFSRELEEVGRNRRLRTTAQIRSLRLTLRECSSFGAYPQYVQAELCRAGLLERYCRGRVILREGHLPGRVYFILSGTVVLTRFNKELKEEETLQILNKGDIFGDSEVLEQTARVATVTTALDSMFWSVEGQDFKNSMTRNLEDMYKPTCPLHKSNTCSCTKSSRLRGSMSSPINEDSESNTARGDRAAQRSGTLTRDTPRGSIARDTPRGSITISDANMAHRGSLGLNVRSASVTAMTARSAIHSFLSALEWFEDVPTTKFLEDPKAATLVYFRNNKCIVQSSSKNDLLCFVRAGKCDVITRITIETHVRPPSSVSCFDTGMKYHNQNPRKIRPVTGIIRNRDDRISIISRPVSAPSKTFHHKPCKMEVDSSCLHDITEGVTSGSSDIDNSSGIKQELNKKLRPGTAYSEPKTRLHSAKSTCSTKSARSNTSTCNGRGRAAHKPEPPLRQEFLKVCTLEEGDVYGLTSLFVIDGELETSLVSRGCECVIVKKDTFRLLLNKQTKDAVKEKVLFYPSYEEMKKKLLNLYSWSTYKENLKIKTGRTRPPEFQTGLRS